MTEMITQDAAVDVVDTCLNKIPSPLGRKITELFIAQVAKTLPLMERPAGRVFPKPTFLLTRLIDDESQREALKAIEAEKFEVPRSEGRSSKWYMLHWQPKSHYFVIHAVFPR